MFEAEDIVRDSSRLPVIAPPPSIRLASIRPENRRAFSLAELMVIVVILGVIAVIAVPKLDYAITGRYKAETTARKIVTDLRRVRGLAVANAANNTEGYGLLMLPPSPHTGYEIVETGPPTTTLDFLTIDSDVSVTCPSGATFRFGPLGDLQLGSGAEIAVSAEGKSFTITVVSATGAIKCVEN